MKNIISISVVVLAATLGLAQTAPTRPAANAPTEKGSAAPSKAAKKKSSKRAKPTPVQVETAPAPPPPPPNLAQQPPVAPNVIYQNGLLSIDAPNSTLGDILGGIRRATGASIEGPTAISDRMVVHLGPGEPRQIVASLLGGSRFDYIVMGSPQQPNGINKLVLLARQGGAPPVTGAVSPAIPQQRAVAANTDEDEDEAPERDENADAPPSQPVVAQPEPQYTGQPMPPEQNANQPEQQNQDPNNPNAPKTPEQLYKELQSLERQRQTPTPTQRPQTEQPPQPPPPQ